MPLVLSLLMMSLSLAWGYPANPKIDPELLDISPYEEVSVIVKLAVQVDPSQAVRSVKGRSRGLRLGLTTRALKDGADSSQRDILSVLSQRKSSGLVSRMRPLWIFNGIAIKARRDVIDELAARPDVMAIYPDRVVKLLNPIIATGGIPETNLNIIHVPDLWGMGNTGQGVVVASMDSGVDITHPDLTTSFRGGANSWYDPSGEHLAPYDADGHGTGTMGIMVGGDAGGTNIGVAPGAKWVAVKIFDDAGDAITSGIHAGYQWLMDPDGNPATDDAPDIVNNSWGFLAPGACDREFAADVLALRSAGIVPVFSAGNSGSAARTDVSPANYAESMSVGATDDFDAIAPFSSRGPSSCDGAIFPVISAPGVNIRTTALSHGGALNYRYVSGTSFSAPHVSGVAALLLCANPSLTIAELESALISGAVDLPPAGPDNAYGYGRLDALGAYNAMVASGASGNFDDCAGAKVVNSLPYGDTASTVTATRDITDPAACVSTGYTVWYTYTPTSSCRVSINTSGSGYDTVLAVYTGSCGSFTMTACNNDMATGVLQSRVETDLTGGTAYYVMVGAYGTKSGGDLKLNIAVVIPPSLLSYVTINPPYAVAGRAKQVTATFRDTNGASDIRQASILINSTQTGAGGAYIYYDRAVNRLYLRDNTGTSWLGGIAPGAAVMITNSQCTVNCASCSASVSGTDLALSLNITFKAAFAGLKKTYAYASNLAGLNTGWMRKGTLAVYASAAYRPAVSGVTPARGRVPTNSPTVFTASYTDRNGGWDIKGAYMLINAAQSPVNGIYVYYNRDSNLLYLRNSANTAWGAGIAPGTAGTLSNGQCSINCMSSSAVVSANRLTLRLAITPGTGSRGAKRVYLYAVDRAGLNSGWVQRGAITVY